MTLEGELRPTLEQLLRTPVDPVLRDPVRLRLQAALQGLPADGWMTFTALRRLLDLTDGNLGLHLRVLVEASYVAATPSWRGRRRTTRYSATPAGRAGFRAQVAALEAIISAGQLGT